MTCCPSGEPFYLATSPNKRLVTDILHRGNAALFAQGEASIMKAYVSQSKDDALLRQSSSGGVFTLLAREVFSKGGVVYGAAWLDGRIRHVKAENEEDLAALRGSKYLKSYLGDSFNEIKSLLAQGVTVLFSGTPCQATSLYTFLGGGAPNLTIVDLVCHGVPEENVWEAYTARFPSPPEAVSFRDKTGGWREFSIRLEFQNGEVYLKNHRKDPFMMAYLANICLKKACHHCTCNGAGKKADITLGDDWGGLLTGGRDKGSSVVLAHTAKGEALFEAVSGHTRFEGTTYERVIAGNQVLCAPTKAHPKRDVFLRTVTADNFDMLVNLWCRTPLKARLRRAVGKLLAWRKFFLKARG
jgi:coenzyme F420-reducing hydrogenase beta subunit